LADYAPQSVIGFPEILFLDDAPPFHAKPNLHQVTVNSGFARHSGAIAKTSRTVPTRMSVGKRICIDALPIVDLEEQTAASCLRGDSSRGDCNTPLTIDVEYLAFADAQARRDRGHDRL
jgi:hypothetical protein